jgi:23S rRNA (pseudouridine1915-N3)-methyltransferase
MAVYLVAVGKLKNAALRNACEDYYKRVRNYLKLEVCEVRDGGRTDRDAEAARKSEGKALLKAVPGGALVVAVTRTGRASSSSELAGQLEQWRREDRDVVFLVGGAHGLDAAVLAASDLRLSLSAMTFPHELARLVLLEQLYRACTISRGEPYHKGTDR